MNGRLRVRRVIAVGALEAGFAWLLAAAALRRLPADSATLLSHGARGLLDLEDHPGAVVRGTGMIVAGITAYALVAACLGAVWPLIFVLPPGTGARSLLRESVRRIGSMAALAATQALGLVVVGGITVVSARTAWPLAEGLTDVRLGRAVLVAAVLPGALLAGWIAMLFDLARTCVSAQRTPALDAIAMAWRGWTRGKAALARGYATTVVATLAAAVWIARVQGFVHTRDPWQMGTVIAVQQALFALQVFVRACWWRGLVDFVAPQGVSTGTGDRVDGA